MKSAMIGAVFGIGILFALSMVSAQQYGMMGDDGQFTALQNQNYGMGGMMGMMQMMSGSGYGGYNSGTVLLSWLTYLLTIVLMIAGIYWLVKTANRR